jgi:hypothetical protein
MTNYDKIKKMSVEEMAELFYNVISMVQNDMIRRICEQSDLEIELVEVPGVGINNHIKWLMARVDDE